MKKKRIAILLGDPTGIGPELVVKLLSGVEVESQIQYVILGDLRVFNYACELVGLTLDFPIITSLKPEISSQDIVIYDYPSIDPSEYSVGTINIKGGVSVVNTLKYAVELSKQSLINGILFAPFNKQAMHVAGLAYESELEYFKNVFNCHDIPGELNIIGELWAMRVTSHVALKEVSSLLSIEKVVFAIEFLDEHLKNAGRQHTKIAVSGLNPHNGEDGLFGTEEKDIIEPAIEHAKNKKINVIGPYPSDTLFLRIEKEHIGAIVCMYHDQAQIGLKLLGFDKGLTLLAGLPIPIATPAHGTAFDIAGKNIASISAIENAFKVITNIIKGEL